MTVREPLLPVPPGVFQEVNPDAAQQLADEVRALVTGDLAIESVQIGRDQRREGTVIVRGRLLRPSDEVFPQWLAALRQRNCTPLLRHDGAGENGSVELRVMSGIVRPAKSNPWINLVLFVLTLFSTLLVGVNYAENIQLNQLSDLFLPATLIQGWPFATTIMAILLAHEFGHYFAARWHKISVTLPYFIPLPLIGGLSPGTMGAFIRLKELVPDRRKLFDVGVAGPLAGFVVALPLLFYGVATSPVKLPPANTILIQEGNSLLYLLVKFLFHGKWLPNALTGEDIFINGVTAAAWFGLFVTALNLLPIGQLDGGHTVFAMFGGRARRINQVVLAIMAVLAIISVEPIPQYLPAALNIGFTGWFLWLGLIYFVIGPYHPPALDDVTELDPRRRWIGYLMIVIFILTFVPVPERIIGL